MSRNLDREHAFEYMYSLLFEKADDKTNELILDNTPQNECQQGPSPSAPSAHRVSASPPCLCDDNP